MSTTTTTIQNILRRVVSTNQLHQQQQLSSLVSCRYLVSSSTSSSATVQVLDRQQKTNTCNNRIGTTIPTRINNNNNNNISSLVNIRNLISVTTPMLEKQTMKVPTMGDSITEGTIVEWVAKIGQAVSEDDVIAIIETDKVTIEIKATTNGVITQHFGSLDETVEVGAPLYEVDTKAVATVVPTTPNEQPVETPIISAIKTTIVVPELTTSAETVTPQEQQQQELHHRVPSIHFLGKDGWANLKSGTVLSTTSNNTIMASSSPSTPATTTTTTVVQPSITGASTIIYDDVRVKHPLYGRPLFTEQEIEALLLGGASIAPTVIRHSTGAQFQQ